MKNSKNNGKQMLFEMMHKVGGMPLKEEYRGTTDYNTPIEPNDSFNPDEHPKYSNSNEYIPSNREGITNGISNSEIENFFNLYLKDSEPFRYENNIPFDVMKDEVFSAMRSFNVSNIDDLFRRFSDTEKY